MTKLQRKHRVLILNKIFSELQQITQWLPCAIHSGSKYMHKAESLIELLEEMDCGSHGGFDRNNPIIRDSGFELYDRFTTLVRKYKNEKDIKKCCQFDLNNLKNYFKQLSTLRESFNK